MGWDKSCSGKQFLKVLRQVLFTTIEVEAGAIASEFGKLIDGPGV
jgi:hypothetical protein